jgi:16S rRNA (uracil1498-N3)-methyltransferase
MARFFVESDQISDGVVTIIGADVNHIKNVLRKKVGDEITVSDGNMPHKSYRCPEGRGGYNLLSEKPV